MIYGVTTMQCKLSNEFNVAISVLSSQHSNMIRIVPSNASVEHEVYIGLILQYHNVGLGKIDVYDNVVNEENAHVNNTK